MFTRTTILLKPLLSGASGHARLWTENGRRQLQLTMRGIPHSRAALYAYRRGEAPEKLCEAAVSPSGETVMRAADLRSIDALMVIGADDPSVPLLAGLCGSSNGDAWMAVHSAAQALCRAAAAIPSVPVIPPEPEPEPTSEPEPPPILIEPILPPPKPSGPPADRLRPLRWPRGFDSLRPYFEQNLPRALFPMPGWRFVQAAQGLWIGMQREDGWVRRVAYACEGRTPPAAIGSWRAVKGSDGAWYQMMVQDLSGGN